MSDTQLVVLLLVHERQHQEILEMDLLAVLRYYLFTRVNLLLPSECDSNDHVRLVYE